MTMTLEQLVERCRYWQGVLRLQDWDITVSVARRHEMHTATSMAQVWVSNVVRRATIKILDPIDFQPDDDERSRDLEDSLIHELLHLHFADFRIERSAPDQPRSPIEIAEERLIDAVSGALLRLARATEAA